MNNGWIKIYRKLRESPVYKEGLFLVFMECLLSSTHKELKIDYAGSEYLLLPGQFIFGKYEWGRRLSMSPSTVRKRIHKLLRLGIIVEHKSNHFSGTIYQIEKWDEYQSEELPSNLQVTSKEPPSNPNNNVKNERKKEYRTIESLDTTVITEIAEKYQVMPYEVKKKLEDLRGYCESHGKTYSNYRATLMNWVRKDLEALQKKITILE